MCGGSLKTCVSSHIALPGQRASPRFDGQDGGNDGAESQERGGAGFGRFWPFKLSDVLPSQAAQLARESAAELQKLQETAEQADSC